MSGGGGGPIIIRRLAIQDPTGLPKNTIERLRDIADKSRLGLRLTFRARLYVALAALRALNL